MHHMSDLIGDIVGRLQRERMALLNKVGHNQNPEVEEPRQVFMDSASLLWV